MIKNKWLSGALSSLFAMFSTLVVALDKSGKINNDFSFLNYTYDAMRPERFGDFFNLIKTDMVCTTIISIIMFLIFYKFFARTYKKSIIVISLALSTVFAFCELIGYYMNLYTSFFTRNMNFYEVLFNIILVMGYICLMFPVFTIGIGYLTKNELLAQTPKKICKRKYFQDNVQSVFAVMLFLILCWGIYYLIFFPGVVTADSYRQIREGLGFVPLTDEHPFIHTVVQGTIIKIGSCIFGNVNRGVAFFTFVQMTTIATVVSLLIRYLARKQVPELIRFSVLLFYALHPIIAMYSITLWKDIWVGIFVLAYVVLVFEICSNQESFFKSKKKIIFFIFSVLSVLFSKGTGVIVIVLTLPFIMVCAKKYWKQLSLSYIAVFTVFFATRAFVMPYCNITSGHLREPLSVPIQQISRTVKYHKQDLSDYEYETINKILPIEDLGNLYMPRLSDNTKGRLNEKVFSEDPIRYIGLWFNLGLKYPTIYLDSFLSNSYGYWYTETIYWKVAKEDYVDHYNSDNSSVKEIKEGGYQDVYPLSKFKVIAYMFINYALGRVPIINLFFSIGVYFWIDFVCLVIALIKKKYNLIPIFIAILSVFFICIGSPVYAECRYAYAAITTLPFFIVFSLFNIPKSHFHRNDNYGEQKIPQQDI